MKTQFSLSSNFYWLVNINIHLGYVCRSKFEYAGLSYTMVKSPNYQNKIIAITQKNNTTTLYQFISPPSRDITIIILNIMLCQKKNVKKKGLKKKSCKKDLKEKRPIFSCLTDTANNPCLINKTDMVKVSTTGHMKLKEYAWILLTTS